MGIDSEIQGVTMKQILSMVSGTYGTPVYVFDTDSFQSRIKTVAEAFGSVGICYCVKANPFLIAYVPEFVSRFEVCSYGEFCLCRNYEIEAEKIFYTGVYKEEEEIKDAILYGVRCFSCESLTQLELLEQVARDMKVELNILLRLGTNNQFGMDEADIKTIIGEADKYNLHFAGIHFFDKSQKRDVSKIGEELLKLESLCREIKEKFGYAIEQIEYGPGLDADYFSEWPAEAEKKLLKEAAYVLREFVQNYHVTIEMGRFFSACCGYYLTKVVDLKCCGGLRYAIVDGGSHQLHYDGQMMGMKVPPVCILQRRKETDNMGKNEFQEWAICGSLCTHNDLISRRVPFQNLQIGDILCFAYIGAYSVTEGMTTFLTRDIPPVVLYSQKTGLICMRKRMETVMLNGGCMTERGIYRE